MGYYTNYSLTLDADQETYDRVVARVAEVSDYSHPFDESIKWYYWEANMRKVSLEFPGLRMTVEGEGEESGDIWVAYILDGKVHKAKAKIQLPDFDPTQLV